MKYIINESVVSSPYSENLMIYHSFANKYYLIKGNGKEIWELLKESKSVDDICTSLSKKYAVATKTMQLDVCQFISSLESNQLITRE